VLKLKVIHYEYVWMFQCEESARALQNLIKHCIMNNKITFLMYSVSVLRLYKYGKVTTGVILATYPIFVNNF
jgi:hypothetical protein